MRPEWIAWSRRIAPLLVVILPMMIKSPLILGLLNADSAIRYAGITISGRSLVPGVQATLDPNIGFTSHALGTLAARSILAGDAPWWNPYEGVGAPLAGEMQSAALFPPTLLLLLPSGQVLEHVLFQVIAGLATYGLLRQLRTGLVAAFTAAILFEFNGVYALLANAVVNPICFLPVTLVGVERVRCGRVRSGGMLVAAGVGLSIYAGFPEVAYLDGLLALIWAGCRFATPTRDRGLFVARLAVFGTGGVLLTAPLLAAFADYLLVADVGEHGRSMARAHLDWR